MSRYHLFLLALFGSSSAWGALEVKPWLPCPYEPQLHASYTYSTFRRVSHATQQLNKRSHDHLFEAGAGLATMTNWAGDLDIEFARTPRFSFGLRSVGAQLRKQWLNDIEGDFLTLTPCLALRVVPPKPLKDVSTPYHYQFNTELNAALGKEWSKETYWRGRAYWFTGVGIANRGSPWVRSRLAFLLNREDQLQFETFAAYYRGFGHQVGVNTKTDVFDGWKGIDHRSIDAGASFRYTFGLMGSLSLEVTRRLYARSYPEKVLFFMLRYDLPLSF